ncbi:MAG: hypothetical protein K0R34_2736 [Herbinix sp.]|jgi:hypothetical protein|nr:hypothetical protein [Herbinix sp.]
MNQNMRNSNARNNNNNTMGHVRVFHTVPDAPNVDIYADGNKIVEDIAYGEYTDYLSIPEGTYKLSLYATGTDTPVLTNMLTVKRNTMMTVAAAGMLDNIGFLAIPDANVPMETGKAMIRFAHLSPNAPAVDITLPDGTPLFRNVSFKQLTNYVAVPPGNYTVMVRLAGTTNNVLTVPNLNLGANNFYTAYAIGLAGESPELEAVLTNDKK